MNRRNNTTSNNEDKKCQKEEFISVLNGLNKSPEHERTAISFIKNHGFPVDFTFNWNNEEITPLICAIRCGKSELAKAIIEKSNNLNLSALFFPTPLAETVDANMLGIFKLLIEKGATPVSKVVLGDDVSHTIHGYINLSTFPNDKEKTRFLRALPKKYHMENLIARSVRRQTTACHIKKKSKAMLLYKTEQETIHNGNKYDNKQVFNSITDSML